MTWNVVRAAGRSGLRRAAAAHAGRRRRYGRRFLVVLFGAAMVLLPILAVNGRWMPLTGPGWILYYLHDHVFLPVKGAIWASIFPYSLVWLILLGVVSFALVLEFLSPFSLLRQAHRAVILRALESWVGRRTLLASVPFLRLFGQYPAFAAKVVGESLSQEWGRATVAFETGERFDPSRLLGLGNVRFALSQRQARDLLSSQEVLLLADLCGGGASRQRQPLARTIALGLEQVSQTEATPQWAGTFHRFEQQSGEAESLRLTLLDADRLQNCAEEDLERLALTASAAAAWALFAATSALKFRSHLPLQVFDVWSRTRSGPESALRDILYEAEGLISFEFWAAAAERGADLAEARGLLETGLPPARTRRALGEVHARFGTHG